MTRPRLRRAAARASLAAVLLLTAPPASRTASAAVDPAPTAPAPALDVFAQEAAEEDADELPSIAEKTEGMERMKGYLDLYWDDREGKLYLEVDRWRTEFLYQVSLATGLGSNPVGLDRGQLGRTFVVEARRVGPRVLLAEPNYRYRARSERRAEVEAVKEAFAPSILWGFEAAAETGDRVLVDATDFFLRDAHDVVQRLEETGQGAFELAGDRSALYLPRTRAFPKNTEVEATLTFTAEDPGPLVQRTAATGEAVTLRVHHSLVQLPEPGYEPRRSDPRVGAFGITFHDYARPIDRDLEVRWVARHRLRKKHPEKELSEPVEPLVYYVDPGVPEPVRSALIEGASWWEQAFRAAGFKDAFRVEVLPEDADPMDLRYNVIHWTHRRTRGWSYGSSVVDPRTGEILKANVNLGSLRLRQDHLIGEGLVPQYASATRAEGPRATRRWRSTPTWESGRLPGICDVGAGTGSGYLAQLDPDVTPTELALARVRQLSAHEVGHTLGLAHNFAASTYGRASVMDYPAPLVRIEDDGFDLSDAYDVGIGEYDEFAVRWLYSDFPGATDEEAALDSIVADGLERGMRFLSDADARPAGAAHPLAGLWDNGSDPVAMLRHELEVRRRGLSRFGPEAIRMGEPLARLEEVLVPLYLHHRYQLEAAAHTLAGVDYSYAVRGDGQPAVRRVSAERQREALSALLATLEPSFLAIPDRILETLPPRAFGMPDGETFGGWTSPTFDPLGVASSTASFTLRFLLQPQRMARLAVQHARDPELPGLREVLNATMEATWYAQEPEDPKLAALHRIAERAVVDRLLEQAGSDENAPFVRAELSAAAERLASRLGERDDPTPHELQVLRDIRRWQDRPEGATEPTPAPELPPGSPIGGGGR